MATITGSIQSGKVKENNTMRNPKYRSLERRLELAERLERKGELIVDGIKCVVDNGFVDIRLNNIAHLVTWDTFIHLFLAGNDSWKGSLV